MSRLWKDKRGITTSLYDEDKAQLLTLSWWFLRYVYCHFLVSELSIIRTPRREKISLSFPMALELTVDHLISYDFFHNYGLNTYFTLAVIFVFPDRLTPILTSLSLSRTAHFGAANSTRAG